MTVLVSVIIPTFNSGSLLREALDSVLAQTMSDYEIIVIDDGSTDDTAQVITAYGSRVHYYLEPHQGASMARWTGVSIATGKYIAALDADDWWSPNKLERQVKAMESNPDAGLCYTDGYRWTASDPISSSPRLSSIYVRGRSGWQFSFVFKTGPVPTSSMFFRRDAYEAVGGYDTDLRYCDAEFVIRIAAQYPCLYIHEPLMAYRVHSRNTSSRITRTNVVDSLRFLRLIRIQASSRIQPDLGDFSVRLYRRGPPFVQWALLIIWRLQYTDWKHTLNLLYHYGRVLIASR